MIIRQADESDVRKVKEIIASLQITRNQKGWKDSKVGFFEYPKTEKQLLDALNQYFIVGETSRGVKGFCLAYDNDFFRAHNENTNVNESKFILDNIQGKYLYVDQMGVLEPDNMDSARIINGLVNQNINLARKNGLDKIIAFVCHEPYMNKHSIKFLERMGFRKFDEVEADNDVLLGAYERKL